MSNAKEKLAKKEQKKREFLHEGQIIELKLGHTVNTLVPSSFVYGEHASPKVLVPATVIIGKPFHGWDTHHLVGRYVVRETAVDGGGTAMNNDVYPNGHHVWCQKLLENGELGEEKVDFFQSGAFTAMIEDIKPVGIVVSSQTTIVVTHFGDKR